MIVDRADGSIAHRHFYDLPEFLAEGDVLVFNDSRVIPARLYANRTGTGGKIELLLLNRIGPGVWRSLVRPARRMQAGASFEVPDAALTGKIAMRGEIVEVEAEGTRIVRLENEEALHEVGVMPLPPYIHETLSDPERYQTVYSRIEGSVAAPTAGLHFTPELLDQIRSAGVQTVFVTLHVGWDSFRPVKADDVADHKMHSEYWELGQQAAGAINDAKAEGRRVLVVGTTATRLLENAASVQDGGRLCAGAGWADIFITPGYRFQVVDAMVTNFHLPKSTLLMLTSALAGRELILKAYGEAVESRYRFYSFGDGMLIV
jgi:S-adenosylmethionine:tRNA ribosyltransferase-isomerase